MRRIELPVDINELYQRYLAGKSTRTIAAELGCDASVISNRFRKAGFELRAAGRKTPSNRPSDNQLLDLYITQELSSDEIGRRYGIGSTTVRLWLRKLGVTRQQPDTLRLMYSRMTVDQRMSIVSAAHAAVRGSTFDLQTRINKAIALESISADPSYTSRNIGAGEDTLRHLLIDRSLTPIRQKAIGPYNADLAIGSVAVEVFGGSWHDIKNHTERFRYFFDNGWHVIVIRTTTGEITPKVADYIVTFSEFASSNPTATRQYRVVRSNGELVIAGCAKDDNITLVPSRKRGLHITCDHSRPFD